MDSLTTKARRHEGSHEGNKQMSFRGFLRAFVASWFAVLFVTTGARAAEPDHYTFRNHVQPVLAKFGCSSGACHGAAAGQNGFKLSLRGYDDLGDWRALTRGAMGRRIVPQDPSASLLLQKPTGGVPHKGGVKFSPDSLEFRVLAGWIADGAPPPADNDPRIVRIEVIPPQVTLKAGDEHQMTVMAHFTDGSVSDVTRWVKYTAANPSVATIDDATG